MRRHLAIRPPAKKTYTDPAPLKTHQNPDDVNARITPAASTATPIAMSTKRTVRQFAAKAIESSRNCTPFGTSLHSHAMQSHATPLQPEVQQLLDGLAALGGARPEDSTVAEVRATYAALGSMTGASAPPVP